MSAAVRTVGVFIDAENLPSRVAAKIFEIAGCFGRVVERRAYGDFSREALKPWLDVASRHALSLQTAPSSVAGKNSSDIHLAIDVAEAMCRASFDVFCIASSDSDFTPLASRLRMRGFQAIGVGGRKAADLLRTSFDEFFELDLEQKPAPAPQIRASVPKLVKQERPPDIGSYVRDALSRSGRGAAEWIDISRLGSLIREANPNFKSKDFGSAKFSTVLKNCGSLEMRSAGGAGMQVRMKQKSANLTLINGDAR